jgi:hypothetical protein
MLVLFEMDRTEVPKRDQLMSRVYQMIGAVSKLIIFSSMVNRIINASINGRVTVQVYDTCLQMFDVCILGHTAHIEARVQFLPHSDQHVKCDGLHSRGNSVLQIRYARD